MTTEQTSIVPYGAAALRAQVENLRAAVMVQDIDYGLVPGSNKMVLLKPGAEKMCSEFGFYPSFEQVTAVEQFDPDRPLFHYRYRAVLYRIGTGERIAEGIGSCNSMEKKYRYRQGERLCPTCGKPTIIKGKTEYGGGWICFAKKGGCGAKFADTDPQIADQQVGQVANTDIFDQINTLDKMAQKRALIAAVLIATNASAYFTQDLEDGHGDNVVDGTFQEMPRNNRQTTATSPENDEPAHSAMVTPKTPKQASTGNSGGWWVDNTNIQLVMAELQTSPGKAASTLGKKIADFASATELIEAYKAKAS